MSTNPLSLSQAKPEVWLVLDGKRVLARLRAAGPSWIHVFIEGAPPEDPNIPFTVVLRGPEGGVVDGLSSMMSTVRRDGRTVLHLRLLHLSTSGQHALLLRFVRDVLNETGQSPLLGDASDSACFVDDRTMRALHADHLAADDPAHASLGQDEVVVSKPAVWRVGGVTQPAHIVRTSRSGRRLVVRRSGSAPSAWETVRLELDLGIGGEPRPIQLVGMVIGTIPSWGRATQDIVVRLARWSVASDRAVWMRWVRHQQRLDTDPLVAGRGPVTRTVPPPGAAGPPT